MNDRGAVALVVALLVGSGVLLGVAALVVDVGNLYVEREQLQSGADAGVVKLAQACAVADPACTSTALATRYADGNAADGRSAVSVVCGRGGGLPACPAPANALTACVRAAPASGSYVEVRTATELPDGATVLPPVFAQAVVGGYRGPTVRACARAAWGAPAAGRTGLAVSACDWTAGTAAGARYPDPPVEQVVAARADPAAGTCAAAGSPGPAGFAWLTDRTGACRPPVAVGGTPGVEPATAPPDGCDTVLDAARDTGRPLIVAVLRGGDRVAGFAAFVVTGWRLPGDTEPSTVTGRAACGTPAACLFGYFTRAPVPGGGPTGGPDFGAYIVGLDG